VLLHQRHGGAFVADACPVAPGHNRDPEFIEYLRD